MLFVSSHNTVAELTRLFSISCNALNTFSFSYVCTVVQRYFQ